MFSAAGDMGGGINVTPLSPNEAEIEVLTQCDKLAQKW